MNGENNPALTHVQLIKRLFERATDGRLKFEVLDRPTKTRLPFFTYIFAPTDELNALTKVADVLNDQEFRCEMHACNAMILKPDPSKETEEEKIVRKAFRAEDRFCMVSKDEKGAWVFRTLSQAIFEETMLEIEALESTVLIMQPEVRYKPLTENDGTKAQIKATIK